MDQPQRRRHTENDQAQGAQAGEGGQAPPKKTSRREVAPPAGPDRPKYNPDRFLAEQRAKAQADARALLKAKRSGKKPEGDSDRLLQGGELQEDGTVTSPLFAKLAPYRRGAVEIGQWYHGIDSDGVERWIGFDNIAGLEDHSYVRIRVREPGDASVQGVQSGMAWTMFEGMYRIRGEITDVEAAARALNKDARKRLGARA